MKIILTRCAAICFVLFFATAGYGQTIFNDLLNLYNSASKPTIEEMKIEALWVGKCVDKQQPDSRVGGIMNSYAIGSEDPIIGDSELYIAVGRAPEGVSEDYYFSMNYHDAVVLHNKVKERLDTYSPVKDSNDPIAPNANELFFSQRVNTTQGVGGVDYTLRKNVTQNGLHYYIVAGRCPFNRCVGNTHYHDVLVMCYVWVNKLQSAKDSDLEMLKDNSSTYEFLPFEAIEQ